MATFTTQRSIDFNVDFAVLQNLTDKTKYKNVSPGGFHVPPNVLLGPSIDVTGVFPITPPFSGTVNSITVNTLSGDYSVTGLAPLWLDTLISKLHQSTSTALAHIFAGDDNITGSVNDDVLLGFTGKDTIHAGAGDDDVLGNGQNDTLFGEDGNDTMSGGAGIDVIDGGNGVDTVRYIDKSGPVQLLLKGAFATTVLVNGVVEDTIKNFENAVGGSGADSLRGDELANAFDGEGGDDTLNGGLGKDFLTGDDGSDTFVFDVKPKGKNVDHVVDFDGDTVALDDTVFKALKNGDLKGKFFHVGKKAGDGNDFVVFDAKKDKLYYDRDGKGGTDQKLVAIFDNNPDLNAGDIFVI